MVQYVDQAITMCAPKRTLDSVRLQVPRSRLHDIRDLKVLISPGELSVALIHRGDLLGQAALEETAVTFGFRLWLLCPGCSRRCGKLYIPTGEMALGCRSCMKLRYRSDDRCVRRIWQDVKAASGLSKRDVKRIAREIRIWQGEREVVAAAPRRGSQ